MFHISKITSFRCSDVHAHAHAYDGDDHYGHVYHYLYDDDDPPTLMAGDGDDDDDDGDDGGSYYAPAASMEVDGVDNKGDQDGNIAFAA